jgi:hypothetical protein
MPDRWRLESVRLWEAWWCSAVRWSNRGDRPLSLSLTLFLPLPRSLTPGTGIEHPESRIEYPATSHHRHHTAAILSGGRRGAAPSLVILSEARRAESKDLWKAIE